MPCGFEITFVYIRYMVHVFKNAKALLWVVLLLGAAACNKDREVVINNNQAPPDYTIDSSTIDLFIDKTYIGLLGREALSNERTAARQLLRTHNFSVDDRTAYLQQLLADPAFKTNLCKVARAEYLQSADSLSILQQRNTYAQLLTQPQYAPFYDVIIYEVERLDSMLLTENDFMAGRLDVVGMHRRYVNNLIYDQINMGTENFVISTFQNFFFRYPTNAELENGKKMVDGSVSIFYLQTGSSKADYLRIFFGTTDYYEGQVRYLFSRYLFRNATTAEMSYYANRYKSTGSYNTLITEILSGNEYAGVQ